VGIFSQQEAEDLLLKGIRMGFISRRWVGDYPQNVWAVSSQGEPLEAQLENRMQGTYHGYPMPQSDPFRAEILNRWHE
jgi:hypothetical protein